MRDPGFEEVFRSTAEILTEWIGPSKIYFLSNLGNWGDGVIRYGTIRFLTWFHLDFEEIISREDIEKNRSNFSDSVLLYQGSGAFCKLWDHSGLIQHLGEIFRSLVILPSSYELPLSTPNTLYFCRDIYESKQMMPESIFCHDLAFFIQDIETPSGNGTGYFFRTDIESSKTIPIPENNIDISLQGTQFSPARPFFIKIAQFEEIHTDRLHVAIAGSLLNRTVHLYPGSYFKNKAVYLSSMKEYYPKTVFHDHYQCRPA
ncbi:MAG: hypothetical protein V2B15_06230 [Bacteroidota bacterium]